MIFSFGSIIAVWGFMKITGIILAGGRNLRMGKNKAFLESTASGSSIAMMASGAP
jgi:hypothetical protein